MKQLTIFDDIENENDFDKKFNKIMDDYTNDIIDEKTYIEKMKEIEVELE